MKEFVLYCEDGVECGRWKTLLEAYKGYRQIREFDKHQGITGIDYWWQLEWEDEENSYYQDIKVYRVRNKIYWKAVQRNG